MLCTIKQNAIKVSVLPNLSLVGHTRNIHRSSGMHLLPSASHSLSPLCHPLEGFWKGGLGTHCQEICILHFDLKGCLLWEKSWHYPVTQVKKGKQRDTPSSAAIPRLISEIQVKGKPVFFHLMAEKSSSLGSSGKLLSLWLIYFKVGLAWLRAGAERGFSTCEGDLLPQGSSWSMKPISRLLGQPRTADYSPPKSLLVPLAGVAVSSLPHANLFLQVAQQNITGTTLNPTPGVGKAWVTWLWETWTPHCGEAKRAFSAGVSPSVFVPAWAGRPSLSHCWQNCQPAVLEASPPSLQQTRGGDFLQKESAQQILAFHPPHHVSFPMPEQMGNAFQLDSAFAICHHIFGSKGVANSACTFVCVCLCVTRRLDKLQHCLYLQKVFLCCCPRNIRD